MTAGSAPEQVYEIALRAHQSRHYRQAVAAYEHVRAADTGAVGQLAAFQLGVICTEARLAAPQSLAYCADIARGAANLWDVLAAGSLEDPLPAAQRAERYICQAMFPGPALASIGHWDPLARVVYLNPEWTKRWIEELISGTLPDAKVAGLLAKWALSVSVQLTMHGTGPESADPAFSDPAVAETTGYGSYRFRWAKAWEEGLSQLATQRHFSELIADLGMTEMVEGLESWYPMPIILYPEERIWVNTVISFTADQLGVQEDELLDRLTREFPDTRLPVLIAALTGRPAELGSAEFDQAVTAAITQSFASTGRDLSEREDLYSLAYQIGYKPFREDGQDAPALAEVVAAQQALGAALPLATTPDELGVLLGQGSSLATLRTLVDGGGEDRGGDQRGGDQRGGD